MRISLTARGSILSVMLCVPASHRADAQSTPPRWPVTRDLRIDADDHDLSVISWVAVSSDGSIAVGQRHDAHIRFFDARGVPLGKFGRDGEGPGEFRSVSLYGWVSDTLWVADASTRRVTLISPARKLTRTFRFPAGIQSGAPGEAEAMKYVSVTPRGMLSDGSLLVFTNMLMGGTKPAWVRDAGDHANWVVKTAEDGKFKGFVAAVARAESCGVSGRNEGGGNWGVGIPFCARPHWSIAPDGNRLVLAAQPRESPGASAVYTITSISPLGDTVLVRQFRYAPIAINKRVADSTRTAFRAYVARQLPPAAARAVDDMRLPSVYPAVKSIVAGRDGTTWIERWTPPGDHVWHVLDASGNMAVAVALPPNVTLQTASRDAIWGIETDDDGLQSVVRFRITHSR